MSNTRKDGDFNLDEELRSKIVADSDGQPINDEHEDAKSDETYSFDFKVFEKEHSIIYEFTRNDNCL